MEKHQSGFSQNLPIVSVPKSDTMTPATTAQATTNSILSCTMTANTDFTAPNVNTDIITLCLTKSWISVQVTKMILVEALKQDLQPMCHFIQDYNFPFLAKFREPGGCLLQWLSTSGSIGWCEVIEDTSLSADFPFSLLAEVPAS